MAGKLTSADAKRLREFVREVGRVTLTEVGHGDQRWIQVTSVGTKDGFSIGFTAGFNGVVNWFGNGKVKLDQAKQRLADRVAHAQKIVGEVQS